MFASHDTQFDEIHICKCIPIAHIYTHMHIHNINNSTYVLHMQIHNPICRLRLRSCNIFNNVRANGEGILVAPLVPTTRVFHCHFIVTRDTHEHLGARCWCDKDPWTLTPPLFCLQPAVSGLPKYYLCRIQSPSKKKIPLPNYPQFFVPIWVIFVVHLEK